MLNVRSDLLCDRRSPTPYDVTCPHDHELVGRRICLEQRQVLSRGYEPRMFSSKSRFTTAEKLPERPEPQKSISGKKV